MKINQFTLNEEQENKKKMLFDEISGNSKVQSFMQDYDCPSYIVQENVYRFKKWIDDLEKVSSLDTKDITTQHLGEYIDLEYDANSGILHEVIRKTPQLQSLEEEKKYLEKYKIMALPKNFHKADFTAISSTIQKESTSYKEITKILFNFDKNEEKGIYLYGDLGVGKSFLSACVTNKAAKNGTAVAFIHIPTFINELKLSFGNSSEIEYKLDTMKRIPLLVLDDLGAEPITSWSRDEILLTILNDRLENNNKTIITGNYKPEHLVTAYSMDTKGVVEEIRARRLVDRILALTKPYELSGKNKRFTK